MIQKGGLYVNGVQEKEDRKMDMDILLEHRLMVVRLGKSTFRIIDVIPDERAMLADRLEAAESG